MTESASGEPAPEETRAFDAPAGVFVGAVDGPVVRVLGIPYAQSERFEPPQPVPPVVDAVGERMPFLAFRRAPAAPQPPSRAMDILLQGADEGMEMSEHCQALSITAPSDLAPGEMLPVMVWIHGGGYVNGAGDLEIYDPSALVGEQRVIVVAVTYRLGILGFYGDGVSLPGNLGLLDLLAALRWVRENITAFGGDSDCVTVFGQSAGGDAVAHLLISEGASGLFRRAIIQSSPLGISRRRTGMTRAMRAVAGIPSWAAPVADVLARQSAAERSALRFGMRGGMAFGVQYGQAPLPPEKRADGAWRDAAPAVDLLIGNTAGETGFYLPLIPVLRRLVTIPVLGAALKGLIVRPSTFAIYGRDARRFAARHRAAGGRTLGYVLRWAPPSSLIGAGHMSDVPLLLGSRRAWSKTALVGADAWPELDRRGRLVRRAWAEFARTGSVSADTEAALAATLTFDRG